MKINKFCVSRKNIRQDKREKLEEVGRYVKKFPLQLKIPSLQLQRKAKREEKT